MFWWHGPEHVDVSILPNTIAKLESFANIAVVLGCPWGDYEQGDIEGNCYEKHVSSLDYPFFENLGYNVECLGEINTPGSNITCVKILDQNLG